MRVLIVEDETSSYENLREILREIDPEIEIAGNTESVVQTVRWLKENLAPDLIFMDIHLSDDSAFAIFEKINVEIPIIFTTAYDQYAIKAFKLNSIDYLLKPIKVSDVRHAIDKFRRFEHNDVAYYLSQLTQLTSSVSKRRRKILIPYKDKLIPVNLSDIAFFYTTDKNTFVYLSSENTHFAYSKTLDQIMATLDPDIFFRANKQFIIRRENVVNITIWFDNRLLVTLDTAVPERIYISKNKAAAFKAWLTAGD